MKLVLISSSFLLALVGSLLSLLAGSSHYPKDPNRTLEHVRHGTLCVGYTQATPWVVPGPQGPRGIEPALVRSLAQSLDSRVEWVPGTERSYPSGTSLRASRSPSGRSRLCRARWL